VIGGEIFMAGESTIPHARRHGRRASAPTQVPRRRVGAFGRRAGIKSSSSMSWLGLAATRLGSTLRTSSSRACFCGS
jgi:hypothetical protein